ncbi:MAG: ABC transporter permease [Myxococcales bacterium]|nr:ABC transporter permease [Myxococcales bacterium]
MAASAPPPTGAPVEVHLSPFQKRWRKFKTLRRGWYSFILLFGALFVSLANPLLINDQALVVRYQGQTYFPVFGAVHEAEDFGQRVIGPPRFRELKKQFAEKGEGDWVLMPPYPYHPNESLLTDPDLPGSPPHAPSAAHWMGTDDRARDVFARLVYGFRISVFFGLAVVAVSYVFGITIGAVLGYFGGWTDMIGQRLVEIWAGLPFLYTVIIIGSIVKPNLFTLVVLLALFGWVGISFYVRGEFYREKSRDYVAAAVAAGESHGSIIFRHILPNALTPVISFAPFALVGNMVALVSLDFLGFGVRPPTASWGELVKQGKDNIFEWHLVFFPLGALFVTLLMVVFIGEAIREAFDPKTWSRLR